MNTALHDTIGMNEVPKRRDGLTSAAGVSLIELLTVLIIVAVMAGIAGGQYSAYRTRVVPERAAQVVGSYVSLTRSYALQRRTSVSLIVDPVALQIMIRSRADTLRIVPLGSTSEFDLTTLDSNIAGDSLTFNPRGLCTVCGVAGKGISVSNGAITYLVTFNAVGRWKRTLQ